MSILNKKIRRGFTIVELMVSVGIIGVISGLFLTNYHRYKTTSEIDQAVQIFMSGVRSAQNNTLSLKEFGSTPTIPPGGWGLAFSTPQSEMIYFADLDINPNHTCENSCNTNSAERYKSEILPNGVSIRRILINGNQVNNNINLTFMPPDPNVYICRSGGCGCNCKDIVFFLEDRRGVQKKIRVNKSGLVEVIE